MLQRVMAQPEEEEEGQKLFIFLFFITVIPAAAAESRDVTAQLLWLPVTQQGAGSAGTTCPL